MILKILIALLVVFILVAAPILLTLAKLGFAGYFIYGWLCVTGYIILERS